MSGGSSRLPSPGAVTLFLCGDVMTGRGVDQVLPHPGEPRLAERCAGSALDYVDLAERKNGPIPRPVAFDYIWGDALPELARRKPDARIVNLETSVTVSEDWEPKGINYRMHPGNTGCLKAAGIDCCVLANNHTLDFGASGLAETLAALASAGIKSAGAGLDVEQAQSPAVLDLPGKARVLVFALGSPSSGVPRSWAAGQGRSGVWVLEGFDEEEQRAVARRVRRWRRAGDIVVVSLHWGGNWGYEVSDAQAAFARGLIDHAGVDVVHGHSSHHPKGVEIYRGKPILYGCGDFINDYEGISGYEEYRGELGFMYFPTLDGASGTQLLLELVPTRIERFQVRRADAEQADWLALRLELACEPFGTRLERTEQGGFLLAAGRRTRTS